jgi:hypothetical protein
VKPLDRWQARGWGRGCWKPRLRGGGLARPRHRACVAGVFAATGWVTASAFAAELSVTGPDACPDASELAFRVERSIGAPLAESAPLRFEVVFEAAATPDASYTARLRAHDRGAPAATSTRVIRAHDCGRLGDAVSVAIALAIRSPDPAPSGATQAEPEAAASAATTTAGSIPSAAENESEHDAASVDRHQPPSEAPEAEEQALSPVLAAFFLVDSGSLPSAGVGLGLSAELRTRRLAFRVQGALLFEQHVALASSGGEPGADMSLALGSASACWSPLGGFPSSLAVLACAGWELGQLTAEEPAWTHLGAQTSSGRRRGWTAAFPGRSATAGCAALCNCRRWLR